MKRKLHWGAITFALIWAFAALLPPVRESARTMTSILTPYQRYAATEPLPWQTSDPIVAAWNLERTTPPGGIITRATTEKTQSSAAQAKTLQQWRELSARFPNQAWIPANQLRAAPPLSLWKNINQLNPLSPADGEDRKQYEIAAQVAARSARREPDNVYWPLMEAAFRFRLGQQAQALNAIKRAGQGTRYQDYVQSTIKARVDFYKQHDNPTWEEKMGVFYMQSLSPLSLIRADSTKAAQYAWAARKRGDNSTALRIGADLLRATSVVQRDSDSYIGSLIASVAGKEAVQILFEGKVRNAKTVDEQKQQKLNLKNKWAAFVRANGQSNLANRADWLLQEPLQYPIVPWEQFGMKAPWGKVAILVPLLLFCACIVCFSFALAWLLGSVAVSRPSEKNTPTRGNIALCTNFTFWALIGLGILLGLSLLNTQTSWIDRAISPFYSLNTDTPTLPLNITTSMVWVLACWLIPVSFANWQRTHRFRRAPRKRELSMVDRRLNSVRTATWLSFLVFTTFVATNGRGLWDNTPFQIPISASIATASFLLGIALQVVRVIRTRQLFSRLQIERIPLDEAPSGSRHWKWIRNGVWLIALAGYFAYTSFLGIETDSSVQFLARTGLAIAITATIVGLILSRKTARDDGFLTNLAIQSAGALSIVCSFAFVCLALFAWPLRTELHHQLDHRLTVKETTWIKEQMAKNPLPSP